MSIPASARPGRPAGQRDTREVCLGVAEKLFADSGFAGTSLRSICAEAGISIATLLHHFGTKEKLYGLVLGRIAQSMQDYIPGHEMTVVDADAVADMVDRHLDWTQAFPHYSRLIMRELMENPERAPQAKQWHMRTVIGSWVKLIRHGQATGALAQFDAEMFVFSFTGAIAHFYAASVTVGAILSIDERSRVIARYRLWLRESTLATLRGLSMPPHAGAIQ
jgi:AcrR family transcriptional regulator